MALKLRCYLPFDSIKLPGFLNVTFTHAVRPGTFSSWIPWLFAAENDNTSVFTQTASSQVLGPLLFRMDPLSFVDHIEKTIPHLV